MIRVALLVSFVVVLVAAPTSRADNVTDWSSTIRHVIQDDGTHPVNSANPGWSTRAMAMTTGAIYDVYQAFNRTNAPFMVNAHADANTSLDAAVHQAAYEVLLNTYPNSSSVAQADYDTRMGLIPAGLDKTNGMALGHSIAQTYISKRSTDQSGDSVPYTPGIGPGLWRPDPFHPAQVAWGPGWGVVHPFAIGSSATFVNALPAPPAMNSPEYTAAFNQVKNYGALPGTVDGTARTTSRTADQTDIGLFWGYDRGGMGPPGVLFLNNMEQISTAIGNTPQENARMFAMASVSMADAAISAWDAKFKYNYWRPVTGIQEAATDGNPNTAADPTWRPLGAPGGDPNDYHDDFTPPFPSWTSGHATMGGALFKSLELFYGTNDFAAADASHGADPVTANYTLTSQEWDENHVAGMARNFHSFTQTGIADVGTENSPEGENEMSRIYLGVHWIFDQRDGDTLGNNIADFVAGHDFQAVPEPSAIALGLIAALGGSFIARRRAA
jgi:hypothetical protein